MVWARDGRELFYREGNKLMAVCIEAKADLTATKPKLLFTGYVHGLPGLPNFDVSPDGQHFLMLKKAEEAPEPAQVNVVVNWFEELKARSRAADFAAGGRSDFGRGQDLALPSK